ncbi:unnamed protein product [Rodentolepis nana]|uniref:DDE-1 domain-containing protein n=1 Tax=Rodentolepis nana TaxID=102285 RepID=A0A0R3TTC3_RODNA|nr:unnamed protein product [Rodentolepis nana]
MQNEDLLNSNPLELIYSNKEAATLWNLFTAMRIRLHYNGTRITPDFLLVSSNVSKHKRRKIIDDPGSGREHIIASITIGSKSMTRKLPTKLPWNFKMDVKRKVFPEARLNTIECFGPNALNKHYRVFWSKHLEEAKRKRDALRNTADQCKRDALRNTADQTGRDALCNTADQTGSATPFATLLIRLEEQTPFATLLI